MNWGGMPLMSWCTGGLITWHLGGFVEWLVETLCSLVIGLAVGAIVVVVLHFIPRRKAKAPEGVHDAEGKPATSDE